MEQTARTAGIGGKVHPPYLRPASDWIGLRMRANLFSAHRQHGEALLEGAVANPVPTSVTVDTASSAEMPRRRSLRPPSHMTRRRSSPALWPRPFRRGARERRARTAPLNGSAGAHRYRDWVGSSSGRPPSSVPWVESSRGRPPSSVPWAGSSRGRPPSSVPWVGSSRGRPPSSVPWVGSSLIILPLFQRGHLHAPLWTLELAP